MKDARDILSDITAEGDPEDDVQTVVEGDVMDVRLGRPDSQPELEFNALANPDAASRSMRSETHAEPEAEIGTDMYIGSSDRRVRLREESTDAKRHHQDASPDREAMVEPRGKCQDEQRPVNTVSLFVQPRQTQTSAAAASDTSRLHVNMTEERLSGDHWMTMQRNRHG